MTTLLQELVVIIELLIASIEQSNPTDTQLLMLDEARSKLNRLKN